MGRYDENYWSPIDSGVFGSDESWGCEITDSDTGLVGSTDHFRASKQKAHDDAWEDLQSKLRDYGQTSDDRSVDSTSNFNSNETAESNDYSGEDSSKTQSKSEYFGSGSYSDEYPSRSNGKDNSTGYSYLIVILLIVGFVVLICSKSCKNDEPVNKPLQYVTSNTPVIESTRELNNLDGEWVKKSTWSGYDDGEEGLVVSFRDNVGTIISLPNTTSKYQLGQVIWKDFNPEHNYLQVYVHLTSDYMNNEVQFKNSNKIKLMNGDIYIRHQMKVSSQQLENTKPNEEVTQQNEPSTKTIDVNSDISGNGNGQVTIYLTNSNCNNVKVFIDGKYSGALTKCYQNESPSCGVQNYGGAIIKEMPVGDHFVTGRDDKGDTWSGKVSVIESVCITYALENFTQAR